MNKAEFLAELRARLGYLPASETEKPIAFYAESIDDRVEDGMTEAEAVAALGSIDDIVREIEAALPLSTRVKRPGGEDIVKAAPPPRAAAAPARPKRRRKWPIVLGAVLLVVVLIAAWNFVLIPPARGGFTGNRGSSGAYGYTAREAAFDPAGLRRLVLDEDNAAVTVTVSPDDQIHLVWQESGYDPIRVTTDGGTLALDRQSKGLGALAFWLWGERLTTELQVPEGLMLDLSAGTNNGGLTAERIYIEGSVEFSSNNGDVTARALRLAALTLDNDNGAIDANDINCTDAVLKNSNGKIDATDFRCDSLDAKTSNGKVSLTDIYAETTLYAKTSNGAVEVNNISAGKSVELRTSNGAIRGTLAGSPEDYRIESKTDNGSKNLPDNWGGGDILLRVKTSNGSIDLDFAGR